MPKEINHQRAWYYGFKLHLAVKEQGEILGFYLTAANAYERIPADWITQGLRGKLIGDKGYISHSLFEKTTAQRLKVDYQTQTEYEESLFGNGGQTAPEKTSDHRNHQ